MCDELQCIISGKGEVRFGTNIKAILCYLRASEKTSTLAKSDKHFKHEETARLRAYITNHTVFYLK